MENSAGDGFKEALICKKSLHVAILITMREFYKYSPEDEVPGFVSDYPTDSRGNGKVKQNNLRNASGQGAKSAKLKVGCRICGFNGADIRRDNSSGGNEGGNAGYGAVTIESSTVTLKSGDTYTDYSPEVSVKRGGGCPFCGSQNYSRDKKNDVEPVNRRVQI